MADVQGARSPPPLHLKPPANPGRDSERGQSQDASCSPQVPISQTLSRTGEKQPRRRHQRSSSSMDTRSRSMRSHLCGAIAIAAMIATPAMAETTTPTSNTMSTPGPGAGTSRPTLSHDGSNSLTNSDASSARNGPGAGASPHTGYSSGMTPSAGTGSGTADGTTDTGATSPGSGKSAVHR
jgi:hypothetical protein